MKPRLPGPRRVRWGLAAAVVTYLGVAAGGCARGDRVARAPAPALPAAGWSYEVVAGPDGSELVAQARFPDGTDATLTVADGGEPFVRDVEVWSGATWARVAGDGSSWSVPTCASGCRVAYRFLLREAGRVRADRDLARAHPGAVDAPPSTWLLRPSRAPVDTPIRFHVTSAPGEAFATGVFPVSGALDTYEARTGDGWGLPYAAFGKIRRTAILGGRVEIAFLPGPLRDEEAIAGWVATSARAVASFYGELPVPRLLVLIEPERGSRAGFGTTMGGSGAAISIGVGRDATGTSLRDDWILVHEMVHTALPDVDRDHHWLEEGLATYVEPLARAQAGLLSPRDLWRDWQSGMPKGLPAEGDQGLDHTHTWGRTYWGGALFCLVADVAIRERTDNRRSLRDALRAIVRQSGNISRRWPVEKVLEVGDAATGVPVLRETFERMASRAEPVDLARLWAQLGVRSVEDDITLDESAPLASIRRAMTDGR